MDQSLTISRPRRWPIFAPTVVVALLAVLWTGGWFYARSLAQTELASWRDREASAGRFYDCAQQDIGGYPFRIEVHCASPSVELRSNQLPVALKAADVLVAAQIYQPTLLIGEFKGPLSIAQPGQPAAFEANWTLAQSSLRGMPETPERISIAVDHPALDRLDAGGRLTVLKADHFELHGRRAEDSAADNPVIDLVLRATAAVAPQLHPLTAKPLDADATAVLRGVKDFAPKPWPDRFKELQANGGTIEITKARVQQDDVIAVGSGTLGLTPRGGLDGQLVVTVVGMDKVMKALDVDSMMSQGDIGAAIGALDRIMPGLGAVARQNAPSIMASLGGMGQRAMLEGKSAVTVPLRFADGAVMFGPFQVGRVPPLF